MLKRGLFIFLGLICILLTILVGSAYHFYHLPIASQPAAAKKSITIPKGASFQQITHLLHEQGMLDYPWLLPILATYRGDAHKIKAGEIEIQAQWKVQELLDALISGKVVLYKLTLPEGLVKEEIVTRIVQAGFGDKEKFLQLLEDEKFKQSLSLFSGSISLEGYLFPETYYFSKSAKEEDILRSMVKLFLDKYEERFKQRAIDLGLTDYQVLTLAAIVEKETGTDADRPLIASVFHNRMKSKMRLESDPTVIYGLEDFDGNLTKKDLQTKTPYNTYIIAGLPPGPICNPGLASLESVLFAPQTDYYYFVAKGDGTSQFSKNLTEHNKAVRKYQLQSRQTNAKKP